MANLTNFLSSINSGNTILLLPVCSQQCFVFSVDGTLAGCLVLSDIAHEVIYTDDIDDVLLRWEMWQLYADITASQLLNIVKITK